MNLIRVIGSPPEIGGLAVGPAVKYMAEHFPFPILEYIFPELVVLNYLFTTEEYTQENIRFTFLGGQAVLGKRKKFMCFIYIISSLKHIVQNYLEYKRFFDWIRQESCFFVHESNGNIVIAALFTSCSFYDKPLPRTRVLGLKLVRDCIQFFNSHHIYKSGEFDENLIPEEFQIWVNGVSMLLIMASRQYMSSLIK